MSYTYQIAADVNVPTDGSGTYLCTPDAYTIEVHEMGLCSTNPIQSQNWVKSANNVVLWTKGSGSALTADVAPGKVIANPPVVQQPPLGSYNYSYVLLKNEIIQKTKAEFKDGTFYSLSNKDASSSSTDYAAYTESLLNLSDISGTWTPYINDTDFATQGLLLKSDKATTATDDTEVPYILGVFDKTANPINVARVVRGSQRLSIKYLTTNRVGIWCDNWASPGPDTNFVFGSLPFIFRVTIS